MKKSYNAPVWAIWKLETENMEVLTVSNGNDNDVTLPGELPGQSTVGD